MKNLHKIQSEKTRKWHVFDAKNQILGRLATQIALLLRGKDKASFEPYSDNGDYVIVLNAEKIKLSSDKENRKVYHHHSEYPGGLKTLTYQELKEKDPTKIIYFAVKGMLPKNKLQSKFLRRLKLVIGDKNPYEDKI
jgi:large subunit ribosomal protein L13